MSNPTELTESTNSAAPTEREAAMSETPRHNTRVPEGIDEFELSLRRRLEGLGIDSDPRLTQGDIGGFVSQTCTSAREYAYGVLDKLGDRFYNEGYDKVQQFVTDAKEEL